jgi:hypothetical protein
MGVLFANADLDVSGAKRPEIGEHGCVRLIGERLFLELGDRAMCRTRT